MQKKTKNPAPCKKKNGSLTRPGIAFVPEMRRERLPSPARFGHPLRHIHAIGLLRRGAGEDISGWAVAATAPRSISTARVPKRSARLKSCTTEITHRFPERSQSPISSKNCFWNTRSRWLAGSSSSNTRAPAPAPGPEKRAVALPPERV